MRDALEGLEVRPERMRENLELLRDQLSEPELAEDLGSAGAFVDRALSRYGEGS
jgi:adenylosuccinate lyase